MIKSGSTMTTEAWDIKYKKNLTWNHAWGAAPANLIPRKLMGVEPLEPGFARVRIRTQVYAGLKEAKLKMPTVRGTIEVGWKERQIDVTVPANMVAEVLCTLFGFRHARRDAPGHQTPDKGLPHGGV
jgi:hypothetical protein